MTRTQLDGRELRLDSSFSCTSELVGGQAAHARVGRWVSLKGAATMGEPGCLAVGCVVGDRFSSTGSLPTSPGAFLSQAGASYLSGAEHVDLSAYEVSNCKMSDPNCGPGYGDPDRTGIRPHLCFRFAWSNNLPGSHYDDFFCISQYGVPPACPRYREQGDQELRRVWSKIGHTITGPDA